VGAIFQLAQEAGQLPHIVKDFEKLKVLIHESGVDLSKIASPVLSLEVKEKIVISLSKILKLTEFVTNLLVLLVRNNRFSFIDIIVDEFFVKYNISEGIQNISVVSAAELSAKEQGKVGKILDGIFGKKLELNFEIDQELLGGLVIKKGSLLYDASIQGKLARLKRKTNNEILNMQ